MHCILSNFENTIVINILQLSFQIFCYLLEDKRPWKITCTPCLNQKKKKKEKNKEKKWPSSNSLSNFLMYISGQRWVVHFYFSCLPLTLAIATELCKKLVRFVKFIELLFGFRTQILKQRTLECLQNWELQGLVLSYTDVPKIPKTI